jgi:hypothetical protein
MLLSIGIAQACVAFSAAIRRSGQSRPQCSVARISHTHANADQTIAGSAAAMTTEHRLNGLRARRRTRRGTRAP